MNCYELFGYGLFGYGLFSCRLFGSGLFGYELFGYCLPTAGMFWPNAIARDNRADLLPQSIPSSLLYLRGQVEQTTLAVCKRSK